MSTDVLTAAAQLHTFGEAYTYDASYLLELLEASPPAYEAFKSARDLSSYRWALPLNEHFVARIAAMQGDGCGACTQLNLRMAVEAGVDRELLRTLLERPSELPAPLRDVREHAHGVASGGPVDPERVERLRSRLGSEAFAELALAIAGSRLFPGLKRALGREGACESPNVDF